MNINNKSEVIERMVHAIISAKGAEQRRLKNYLYVTDASKCIRRLWYAWNNIPPDTDKVIEDPTINLIYKYGDMFEAVMSQLIQYASPVVSWRGKARVSEAKLLISGETDPVVEFEGHTIVIEFKATHRTHFRYLMADLQKGEVLYTYYDQIQWYLYLYPEAEFGAIIIGNRDMRPNDDLPALIHTEVNRDEDWKKRNWSRIEKFHKSRDDNVPPDGEFTYNSFECKTCPWRNRSWADRLDKITSNATKPSG